MIQELQTERLDINKKYEVFTTCKQGDNLKLKIIVYDKSLPADLSNYTCRLRAFKRDQIPLIQNTNITITNNQVYIECDEQLTTTAGIFKAELQFVHKTTLQKKSSFYIIFNVISSVFNVDGAISTPTCTLLKQLENDLDRVENIGDVLEEAKDTRDDLIVKTDAANTSNENLVNSTNAADNTKNELDILNTNAKVTKNDLDKANTAAVTNKNNLDAANVQAVKNYEALEQLGDATDLAKKVEQNSSQLNENANEIEATKSDLKTVKIDYAKMEDVNKIVSTKVESSVVEELNTKVDSLASGSPKAVASVSEMTDTTKNYILTTDGNWYYYDGSTWVSGGIYQATEIEKSSINQDLISKNLASLILDGDLSYGIVFENGFYDTTNGNLVYNSNWLRCITYMSVKEKEIYFIEFNEIISNIRCDIIFWDDKLNFISSKTGVESFIVPSGVSFITINCKYESEINATNINRLKVLTLDDIKNDFSINSIKEELECNWRRGYVADSTNTYWAEGYIADGGASSTYKYSVIKLRKGDLLYCEIGTKDTACGLSEFNKNGYVSNILNGLKQLNDFYYVANKDIYVLICNNYSVVTNPKIIVYPSFLYNNQKCSNFELKKYDGYVKSDNTVFLGTRTNYHISNNIILKKGQILCVYGNCSPSANIISKNDNEIYTGVVVGVNGNRNYSYVCKNDYEIVRVTSKDDVSTSIEIKDSTKLTGKTFNMLGDSYVHGHSLYPNLVSYALIAVKNGMTYNEYGINGNGMVTSSGTGTPMVERYKDMVDDADYIGVVGGRNDYNQALPIGTNDDTTVDTFKGGLNILYKGLMDKYIGKKVFIVTLWNFDDKGNKYAQAERDIAEKWGIPVIDSNKFSGVYMRSEAFRTKYCLSSTDVSHLNEKGHKLYANWLEGQILLL